MSTAFYKLLTVVASVASVPANADTDGPKKLFAADMKWAEGSPLNVVKLWGDPFKDGDYGMLVKLPPGFTTGMHSHSARLTTLSN